ncbi:hypothetical protein CHS0354_035544 [Potamilus streckersoni]|uniref:HEPN domain-containing protein n=1 Tax=Potamilus streckersoni TaxID=2493646 RepID=A0AAE0RSS4_9BIVA|nr:hypothetical protein CHS0354_035544 [Potamilus streckersoni]
MKLVDFPFEIRKSMEDSGIKVDEVDPTAVVKFLKSHSSTEMNKCRLEINVPVASTRLSTVDNVRTVIRYIEKMENFSNEINQLPLLVTNDEFLRLYSSEKPVIISKFWDLFQHCSENFLHRELVSTCQSKTFKDTRVLCELDVSKVEKLLPSVLSPQQFKAGKDVYCNKLSDIIPNKIWIIRFWECFHEISVKYTEHGLQYSDRNAQMRNAKILEEWSFLPVKQNDKDTFILRPINQGFTIVDMFSFDSTSDLRIALQRLDLPRIDTSIFNECRLDSLSGILNSLVASHGKPLELLNCLYFHKEKIRSTDFAMQQCNSFLVYLTRHMSKLREVAEERWIRDRIKALPLHITQQGTATSLDGNENVLVIPIGMSTGGIGEWAAKTGHILLRQNSELDELHKFLGCVNSSNIDIYHTKILPRFDALPSQHHIEHLDYVSQTLLQTSQIHTNLKAEQRKLITVLKSTPFILTNEGMKCASKFYDPFHTVFSHMCDEGEFPPTPFNTINWNSFMKLAGLRTEVTGHMFVEFAEKVARKGAICVTKDVQEMSLILIRFLLDSESLTFQTAEYERIAKVKFIPAHIVSNELISTCKQYSDCKSLICFSKSIPASFEKLCWTSMSLLPTWAYKESEKWRVLSSRLGVESKPPIERVILHCQIICDTQKKVLFGKTPETFSTEFLKDVLESIYSYLLQHKNEDPDMKEKLKHTPLVLIPDSRILLPVRNIVIELSEEDAVEPYLYKAPVYYGKYHDLFSHLGAVKKVTCNHYFTVLEAIYHQQKGCNEKLLPNELRIVKKAIANLVKQLTSMAHKANDLDVGTLYFPNRDLILKDARSLIVSDLRSAEKRLVECKLDFFIGFIELEIEVPNPRPIINALPDCCRPKLLTEIAKNKIDMSKMTVLESSNNAECIEHFLHSAEFVHGIVRLVKHIQTDKKEQLTRNDEVKMDHDLRNLKVREVTGLYTYLALNGTIIQSSQEKETWSIDQKAAGNTIQYTLYFQSDSDKEMTAEQVFKMVVDGIYKMTTYCIEHSLGIVMTKILELHAILNCYMGTKSIDETLDMKQIDPYNSSQNLSRSIFPRPGTYVPKEFHAFLEQGFSEFQNHEYESLAYELEDDIRSPDNAEPVYIYVRIIKPLTDPSVSGIRKQYLIDVGYPEREHIRVYTYTLFKFERKQDPSSQELVSSDVLPVDSLPIDSTCSQIRNLLREAWNLATEERHRILRRLMLRWHPDRNIGQEEYCTRVFTYIREIVLRLDRGQSLEGVSTNKRNYEAMNAFTGTVYEDLGRRVNRRSEVYRQQHSEQENTFYHAHTRVHAGRSSCPVLPAPDQPNARRWILQAKKDLLSAKMFHPLVINVPAFNWICYHCQQAIEKALKAAVYANDANKVDLNCQQLVKIATKGCLSQDLVRLAGKMESCAGAETRMRYPDSISRTHIPAELYTDVHARTALEIAEEVIQLVDENYIN